MQFLASQPNYFVQSGTSQQVEKSYVAQSVTLGNNSINFNQNAKILSESFDKESIKSMSST